MFYDQVYKTAEFLKGKVSDLPTIGVILGSGLGGLADVMENRTAVPYQDIPGFPQSNLEGHAGNLVFGRIGDRNIAAMQGRFHFMRGSP